MRSSYKIMNNNVSVKLSWSGLEFHKIAHLHMWVILMTCG